MFKLFRFTLAFAVAAFGTGTGTGAWANEAGAKDAIAMVEKAADMIKKSSVDAIKAKIAAKDPDLNKGELYVYLRSMDGTTLAHPNPGLVGKNLIDVPDADGKVFRRDIVDLAKSKGKGWVDYKFKNPVSGKVEPKSTYILRQGDLIIEAGIYK